MFKFRQFLAVVFVFLINNGFYLLGQDEMKYKDIFNFLQIATKEEIYPRLQAYREKDPHFANTYYQLGLISEEWARGYDPLTEHTQVEYFVYKNNLLAGL